jgi:protein-tyrosine-phosphatase
MTTKILVVCHGSINRSPLAGYLLKALLPEHDIRIRAMRPVGKGERATRKVRSFALEMLQVVKDFGFADGDEEGEALWKSVSTALENHRSVQCTLGDMDWAEVIVYMDGGNLKRLQQLCDHNWPSTNKPYCLANFLNPPKNRIADPAFMRAGSEELGNTLKGIVQASYELATRIGDVW